MQEKRNFIKLEDTLNGGYMRIKYRTELPELMRFKGLPMIAVELGVAEGYNCKDLLNNGIEKLYAIDNWNTVEGSTGDGSYNFDWHFKNLNAAKERLKPHGDKVILLRGLTNEMAWIVPDNTCGLVYVDCDHTFLGVWNDIKNYWSKLVSGGVMAFHDFEDEKYGVKEAVTQFAKENNLEIHLLSENKKEDAGAYIIKP